MPIRLTPWSLAMVFAAAACAGARAGASDASLANARAQAASGAEIFGARCANCHGERGEGKAYAPSIMGPGALPVYPRDSSDSAMTTDPVQLQLQSQTRPPGAPSRTPFRNARDLYEYLLKQHRPNDELKALHPDDLWPLLTFMLLAHGSKVPAGGITAANADQVDL